MLYATNRHPLVVGIALADLCAASMALYVAYLVRVHFLIAYPLWSGQPRLFPTYVVLLLGTLPIIVISLYLSGSYDISRIRSGTRMALSLMRAAAGAFLGVMTFAFILRDHTFSRAIVAGYVVLSFLFFFIIRYLSRHVLLAWYRKGRGVQRLVVVGTSGEAVGLARLIERRPYLGYVVVGFVSTGDWGGEPALPHPVLGEVWELPDLVDRNVIDAVLFGTSLDETTRYERIIWKLEEVGKTVHLRGDAVGVLLSRTYIGDFEGVPVLTLRSTPADPLALAAKRVMDVVLSAVGLIVLSPVMAATAVAIKLTSPGPVIFRQERVGLNGRRFEMLKFRSMYVDAEKRLAELMDKNEMTGPAFKMRNDPRMTPVGRWIRKFSIDELPQLWNVLRGDMSLVGPRPPLPEEVDKYERWQRRRLSMKPGITCLWQVSGRNDLDFETWMRLDMEYIDNWSLGLDVRILIRTLPAVLLARGAR